MVATGVRRCTSRPLAVHCRRGLRATRRSLAVRRRGRCGRCVSSTIGVSTKLGQTALTVRLVLANSSARLRIKPIDAMLGGGIGRGISGARSAPRPRRRRPAVCPRPAAGPAAPAGRRRTQAVRLVAMIRSQVSRLVRPKGALSPMPALRMTRSIGPLAARASSKARVDGVAVGDVAGDGVPPAISAATASSGSRRRPSRLSFAPSAASARAVAAPMPLPPPVIRA